jgi:hypothetical protein
MHVATQRECLTTCLLILAVAWCVTACSLPQSPSPTAVPSSIADISDFSGWPPYWPTIPVYPHARNTEVRIKDIQSKLAPDYVEVITIRSFSFQSADSIGTVTTYYESHLANLHWTKANADKWQRCLISEYRTTKLSLLMHSTQVETHTTQIEIIVQEIPGERCSP